MNDRFPPRQKDLGCYVPWMVLGSAQPLVTLQREGGDLGVPVIVGLAWPAETERGKEQSLRILWPGRDRIAADEPSSRWMWCDQEPGVISIGAWARVLLSRADLIRRRFGDEDEQTIRTTLEALKAIAEPWKSMTRDPAWKVTPLPAGASLEAVITAWAGTVPSPDTIVADLAALRAHGGSPEDVRDLAIIAVQLASEQVQRFSVTGRSDLGVDYLTAVIEAMGTSSYAALAQLRRGQRHWRNGDLDEAAHDFLVVAEFWPDAWAAATAPPEVMSPRVSGFSITPASRAARHLTYLPPEVVAAARERLVSEQQHGMTL